MTIDTNILIAYLGGEEKVVEQIQEWKQQGLLLFISSVAECEILSYPKLSLSEKIKIEEFLRENFLDVPFNRQIAQKAAAIRRNTPSLKLPDAAIAALAIETQTPLITRNIRDFRKVRDLVLITI